MAAVTITGFGIQTGTDRTVYATWNWTESHTKNYNVRWYYDYLKYYIKKLKHG